MSVLASIAGWLVAFIFLSYLIPHTFVAWFYKTQNLKKKYNAQWALVTGASSGTSVITLPSVGTWPAVPHTKWGVAPVKR